MVSSISILYLYLLQIVFTALSVEAVFLQKDKIPPPNKCPEYDTKQSDGEALVQKLWEMWSTLSLPLLLVHSDLEWLYQ